MNKLGPGVIIILDGWGIAPPSRGNAVTLAKTPNINKLMSTYPTGLLGASGEAVGLPPGAMGNSEVGHLCLGAGRRVREDLPRISDSIADGTFYKNEALLGAVTRGQQGGQVHLIGLVSTGGVHSSFEHALALMELCRRHKVSNVLWHVILDGRDTAYDAGLKTVEKLQKKIKATGVGRIATVSGRFYAMDRDNHWERTQLAYQAIALGEGPVADDPVAAITESYAHQIYDEQFMPTVITDRRHQPPQIEAADSVIFFNFRTDRARQLTKSLVLPGFMKFPRPKYSPELYFVTMTEYEKDLPVHIAYPPQAIDQTLGQVISESGGRQLRAAETEKYAHVTFFFNGGRESPWPQEDRIMIPSPRVASYDQQPAMGAKQIAKQVINAMIEHDYNLVVVNFANADMVGHTGNIPAIVKSLETVDKCVGDLVKRTLTDNGIVIITGDHGNAEDKKN
jgi:2,3-bisphosphoglycerate-independent phosphoglycerate mutase